MADQAASKIDAATQKAIADAAAKNVEANAPAEKADETVSIAAVAEAVEADAKPAAKPAATKAAAATPARKPAAKRKAPVKKAAAKKVAARKTAAKPAARKTAAARKIAAPADTKTSNYRDTIMTKAKETTADYSAQVKDGFADLQTRAKTVYEKGTVLASDMGDFSKQNVEAVVEAGKILASGMQDMAKSYVADGKAAAAAIASDAREIAAVKSPTEFAQLQSKIASRNFDATVATVSKTTEAWVKLANEAFAPISSRMSVAMDKVRKAA